MPMGKFKKTLGYVTNLGGGGDELDRMVAFLVNSYQDANRVRKALDERFNKGAEFVVGMDRGGRLVKIKRVMEYGKRKYLVEGTDGQWHEPEEKVWAMAMFELGRSNKVT
ncbi:hypothetical protein A3D85_00445 [Candidatus Amesbacteria bacterium RIFCSPHIGHO2_02_FULL_47_9]|uniref:Uncharacterized protein n=1 Tax=Candidatus Amesbacteria bacterium RIFCSPHIGHO2_01_FULL_48_32b TaxID=1797253 RepID=A0A1F4YGZ4_9BACT|nr:MAG: hypothetical protein A2876_05100 [Candidatus Amesbacteria bacterium RIFCSPHIGHO2_01_FULL_48_32b]OGD04894.1 MAG: hypothetical protein A3D85_00445 [Candidatus Amesbacteria bacterium RIFCSPHIGHO2_02_FULL_47_9]OGD07070.1 MAG: hypothetical protein A2899_00355 [Candidatus Amesbacteria bacterium RIFCSPLOWO2_01_FULL_49_25]